MKRFYAITLCLIYITSIARVDAKPRYLQVSVSGENDAANPVCSGSLWFDLQQEQQYGGVYYLTDSNCGITAETSSYTSHGLKFELIFNLLLVTNEQGSILAGAIRALNYGSGLEAGKVERSSIERPIEIGQDLLIGSYTLSDNRQISMHAQLTDHLPSDCPDCGQSAIVLRSTLSRQGKIVSAGSSGRKFLAEAMEFSSNFEEDFSGSGAPRLQYLVTVLIPGEVNAIKQATTCQVDFRRSYHITSVHKENNGNKSEANYSSRNVKEVILEPGKELRLVFPPDTPSVAGFDVVDTLIIIPR